MLAWKTRGFSAAFGEMLAANRGDPFLKLAKKLGRRQSPLISAGRLRTSIVRARCAMSPP